jgi:hypothetical protein
MARESGFSIRSNWAEHELKAFEALVRADEREACAKVCEYQEEYGPLCETSSECADAIRARGETK